MIVKDELYQNIAKLELKQKLKKRYGTIDFNYIVRKFNQFADEHKLFRANKNLYPSIIVLIGCGGAGLFTLSTLMYTFNVYVSTYITIDPDILTVDNTPRIIYPPAERTLPTLSPPISKARLARYIIMHNTNNSLDNSGLALPLELDEKELFMLLDKTNVENALIIEAASYETLRQVSKYILDRGKENIRSKIISVGYSTEEQKFHIFDVTEEPEVDHKPVVNDYSGPIDLEKWWEGYKDIVNFFLNIDLPQEDEIRINVPHLSFDPDVSTNVAVSVNDYRMFIMLQDALQPKLNEAQNEAREIFRDWLTGRFI